MKPISTTHLKSLKQLKQQGFTLVEIAIVLVIVGLLLGGVMKGQELITSAKIRSFVSKQQAVNMAWFSFQDRFQAKPGDFNNAFAQISNQATNGNNSGVVDLGETDNVWQHLAMSGFISGSFSANATPAALHTCGTTACMPNGFDSAMVLMNIGAQAQNAAPLKHRLFSGTLSASVAREIDVKLDDGLPNAGSIRNFTGIPAAGVCAAAGVNGTYTLLTAGNPTENCYISNSNF